jgi:hypothetical protein
MLVLAAVLVTIGWRVGRRVHGWIDQGNRYNIGILIGFGAVVSMMYIVIGGGVLLPISYGLPEPASTIVSLAILALFVPASFCVATAVHPNCRQCSSRSTCY